jgi:hypothetical protein
VCLHFIAQGALNLNSGALIDHYQQEEATSSTNVQQQIGVPQPNISVPIGALNLSTNQPLGGVQPTNSFHSVSSIDSSAEMSKYFPDAQTPGLSPFR